MGTLQDIERIRQFFKPIFSLPQREPRAMKIYGEARSTLYFPSDSLCEGDWEIYLVVHEDKCLAIDATRVENNDNSTERDVSAFGSDLGYLYDLDEYGAIFQRYIDNGLFHVTATKYLV